MDRKSTVPFTLLGVNQKGSPGWKTWLVTRQDLPLPTIEGCVRELRACVLFAGTKAKVISESPAKCHHWLQVL